MPTTSISACDDAALLEGVQAGDSAARGQLAACFGGVEPLAGHSNGGGLMRVLARRACEHSGLSLHEDTIQEVVAETYYLVLRPDVARYSPDRGTPAAYLSGLAHNAAKKVKVTHSAKPSASHGSTQGADEPGSAAGVDDLEDTGADPAVMVSESEEAVLRRQTVEQVVRQAPPVLQKALRLRFWDGASISDIALNLGIERTTLGRQLRNYLAAYQLKVATVFAA